MRKGSDSVSLTAAGKACLTAKDLSPVGYVISLFRIAITAIFLSACVVVVDNKWLSSSVVDMLKEETEEENDE